MIATPNHDDSFTEIPRVCRHLFNSLVDFVLFNAPLSVAVELVQVSPDFAILLKNHLQAGLWDDVEDDSTILGRRLRPRVLNALRPMVARMEARMLVDEIENDEDEKMIPDAEELIPAREEGHDAEKSPCEPVSPDAHQPWLVWIPARKTPSEGGLT